MRYWIWWNDLIQGPFEFDELVLLRAFSEDLLVCMEDRSDWLPASRVADLSSAIEQLRSRRAAPLSPPPPPPSRPPSLTPLQGEFFGEPQEQQTFLDPEDGTKGPYAYRPVTIQSEGMIPYFSGQATMPFHFSQQPRTVSAVIDVLPVPAPAPKPLPRFNPMPIIKESPIRKPVEEPVHNEPKMHRPQVPLRLLHDEPVLDISAPAAQTDRSPSAAPSLDEQPAGSWRNLEWLPWALCVLVSLGLLGSAGYWVMDRYSTRSAIQEANRLEPPKPLSVSVVPNRIVSLAQTPTPGAVSVPKKSFMSRMKRFVRKLFHRPMRKISPISSPTPAAATTPNAPFVFGTFDRAGQKNDAASPSAAAMPARSTDPGSTAVSRAGAPAIPAAATTEMAPVGFNANRKAAEASAPKKSMITSARAGVEPVVRAVKAAVLRAFALMGFKTVGAVSMGTSSNPVASLPVHAAVQVSPPASAEPPELISSDGSEESASQVSSHSQSSHASVHPSKRVKKNGALPAQRMKTRKKAVAHSSSSSDENTSSAEKPKSAEVFTDSNGQEHSGADDSVISESPAKNTTAHRGSAAQRAARSEAETKSEDLANNSLTAGSGRAEKRTASASPATDSTGSKINSLTAIPGMAAGKTIAGAPEVNSAGSAPAVPSAPDLWSGKENDAIKRVMAKIIPGTKITIGNRARDMLQEMHEKELIHAADTGERLYLPDKIVWAALREEGARYRVYLNFLSSQANGERIQSRSYQFLVQIDKAGLGTDDAATQQDMLTAPTGPAFKHNPMAVDIESILGGVDSYNKQKMRAIIVKKNRRSKNEQKNISGNLASAKDKIIRATAFFRRTYSDKAMDNVAQAYQFAGLLKG